MDIANPSRLSSRSKPAKPTRQQQEARIGLLFIAPWLIGFVLLKALPILAAFGLSLTDFKMLTPEATQFIGLENYVRLLRDPVAGANLVESIRYFLLTIPLELVVALVLAAIFTSERLKNRRFSQTLIFMTSIIPATSVFFIFLGSLPYAERLILAPLDLPPIEGFDLLLPFMTLWSIGPGFLIMYLYSGHMLNWIGTWLPLIAPHFFGSAILIFLLRQNFKSIPRDLDEAAMLDGAGPLRILISVILPQSIPVVVTVALLHFFYIWNETRLSSLYLGIAPHKQLISFAVQRNQTYFFTPEVLMVGAMVVMIVPVIVLFLSQRFFMQDMIVTQIEK